MQAQTLSLPFTPDDALEDSAPSADWCPSLDFAIASAAGCLSRRPCVGDTLWLAHGELGDGTKLTVWLICEL